MKKRGAYQLTEREQTIVKEAYEILYRKAQGTKISCSTDIAQYLRMTFGNEENEVFGIVG